MFLISKILCTLICLYILALMVLSAPSNPITEETMLDVFINSLRERNCVIHGSVVLPSYPKMNLSQEYDLGIPLEICMIPTSESRKNFRAWGLCNEVFKVLLNMSSCQLSREKLESIKHDINISVSNDSCKDYPKYKGILPTDELNLASKLTDVVVCKILCEGKIFEKACSFLLWAYRVQKQLVVEISSTIQNISKVQKPSTAGVPTLTISSLHLSSDTVTQLESITTLANDRDNEISQETKIKNPSQDMDNFKLVKDDKKISSKHINVNKNHSGNNNQTEEKIENSHPGSNSTSNQATTETLAVVQEKVPLKNSTKQDSINLNIANIPLKYSKKTVKGKAKTVKSNSEKLTITPLYKNTSSITNRELIKEPKTSSSSSTKTNVIPPQELPQNASLTKSSSSYKDKSTNKNLETTQALASTSSPIPNEEVMVEKMEESNNEIQLPPSDEQEHYIDTENEGDIEGEFPRSEYDTSNSDTGNDENQKSKPSQSISDQLNIIPGDDEDHIPEITESGSDKMQDEAIDNQAISRNRGAFPDQEDNHFFFYFLSIIVVCIAGYLVFHNKQKIIALIIEGRHERRRRSHGVNYKKLEAK